MTSTTARRARNRRGAPVPPAAPAVAQPAVAARRWRPTLEGLTYGLFLALAALSRFWDLGTRALHHDESLHAQFSWMLAVGRGYVHDPLMHGPFLFHANALAYLLFGANDATSRLVPAATGCLLVWLPYLLRGQIGRWGALAASFLLLISPGLLYYSRFIRHDIYTATASLLLFICIIRYVAEPRPRWVYWGAVAAAWAITNHEITYAVAFIFVTFLGALTAWRLSRPLVGVLAGGAVAMGLTALLLPRLAGWPPLPAIPWQTPTQSAISSFLAALLTHPMIVTLLMVAAATLVAAAALLRRLAIDNAALAAKQAGPAGRPATWLDALFAGAEPGTVAYGLYRLLSDRATLGGAILLFAALFAVLFTTLLANLPGLLSGMFGAIGYWLGQHGVRRGEQPWFYYLLLLPQYELIAVTAGAAMSVLTGVRVVRLWLGRRAGDLRLLTHAFLAYWGVLIFLILSWAGEKMPWLLTHITLPFTLLAGCLIGEIIERLAAGGARLDAGGLAWGQRHWRALAGAFAGLLLIIAAIFVQAAATASLATPPQPLPVLPALTAMALAAVGLGLLVGWRRAGLLTALGLIGLLALAQVRFAVTVSFVNGDVPREQLIYVQTAPDVTRVIGEIERLSEELTGGKDMALIYDGGDSGVVWPMEWYLRDFKNRRFMAEGPTSDPGPEVPVLLLGLSNRVKAEPYLTDYVPIEYVLRWHYPEDETYRPFAIAPELTPGRSAWRNEEQPHGLRDIAASVWRSIAAQADPAEQARLWRYLMYREPYAPLGSFNFVLLVRKDLLPAYNGLRY